MDEVVVVIEYKHIMISYKNKEIKSKTEK